MENKLAEKEMVNVSFDIVWQGSVGKFDARMGEISMEGCFIDSKGQEVIGETVDFKVHMPSGLWVTLQGEVVSQEYPIGFELRFTNLTPENRGLLTEVVAAHGGKEAQRILERQEVEQIMSRGSGAARRVLIADDDPMTLEAVKAVVEKHGYEAVGAADGREALTILKTDANFNAAIFDMMMPYHDGLELIHLMKTDERLRHIPIGMITAEEDPKIWNDSIAAGASVFLPKPFTPSQIHMMLTMLAASVALQ